MRDSFLANIFREERLMKRHKSVVISLISLFSATLMLSTIFSSGAQAALKADSQLCTAVGQVVTINGVTYQCLGVLKEAQGQQMLAPVAPSTTPTAKPKPVLPIPTALTACTKIGETRTALNIIFKCAIANHKLVWQSITQHSQVVPESSLYHAPPPLPPQVPALVLNGTPTQSVVGTPIILSPTGGQGLGQVSYIVAGANCYALENKLFSSNAGVCGVIAKKDSDGQYALAFSAFKAFTFIGLPSPKLTISNTNLKNPVGTPITLTTFGGNGNPSAVFKTTTPDCNIQGNVLTTSRMTICYVTATQDQFATFGPAFSPTVGFDFASTQGELTITPASQTVVKGTQINLGTVGGNGTGTVTYTVTGTNCNLSGSALTSNNLGSCSVVANKASDGVYQPVFSKFAVYTFVAAPLIAQDPLKITNPNRTLNTTESAAVSTTGGSGTGALTYVVTGAGCAVSPAGVVTSATPTNCSVSARKAADQTYLIAASNTVVFTFVKPPLVNQAPLTINNPNVTVNNGQVIGLSLSGGSGSGAVSYNISGAGCQLLGAAITASSATNCVVSANKAGDATYNSTTSNTVVFTFIAPIIPLSTEPLVPGGRVLGTKQESPDRECKYVALFELTMSNDFDYKMFQLERNITAYKLRREQKGEPIDIPIAGIIAKTLPVDAEKLLDTEANAKMLPQLAALHRKGMVILVEVGDGNQPPSLPAACWVVYRLSPPEEVPPRYTVPFKVTPATNDVDSLKKAVRPTWDPVEQAKLTVKDYKGNVLQVDAPLHANSTQTAYMVE